MDSFENIYKRLWHKSVTFIRLLVKSDGVAEDLAQEVFVHLYRMMESGSRIKSPEDYIFVCCRNAALDWLKKHRLAVEPLTAQNSAGISDELSVADLYDAEEKAEIIRMNVLAMPEQRRRIFEMSRYQHLSNEQIAERLGISKKTVENHLNLALKSLRGNIHLS